MLEDCPHMIKAVSQTQLRKKFKKLDGGRPICKPCTFTAFDHHQELWACLQCGNIGCGDPEGQHGDAIRHHVNIGDSDNHAIALHIDRDLKCWCFSCKSELDRKGHLKEAVALVKATLNFPHVPQRAAGKRCQPDPPALPMVIPLPPPQPRVPPLITEPVESMENSPSSSSRNQYKGNNNRFCSKKEPNNNSLPPITSSKPTGLTNLGNTCFMNSTLQCLASTRLLIPKLEIFGRDQHLSMLVTQTENDAIIAVLQTTKDDEEAALVVCDDDINNSSDSSDLSKPLTITLDIGPETMTARLRQTIRGIRKFETAKYRDDEVTEAAGSNFRNASSWYNAYRPGEVHELLAKNFRRGAQHDAHELLRFIVDMMKKDQTKAFRQGIMKHYGVKKGGEGSDPTLVDMVKSLDEKVKHKTFVDEVFGGELMTTQTCLTCKRVKSSHEQFLDLSLPLRVTKHGETEKKQTKKSYFYDDRPNMTIMKSLQECLVHFTEAELLTGSNVVECENCHRINLEKIEGGMSPEEVFPSLATSSEKSSTQSSPDSERKTVKKQEERKKRRKARQKFSNNSLPKETVEETETEKEPVPTAPLPAVGMSLMENYFKDDSEKEGQLTQSIEPKLGEGDSSSHTLDGYVVLEQPQATTTKGNETDLLLPAGSGVEETEFMEQEFDDIDILPLVEDDPEPLSSLLASKQISESLQQLNLKGAGTGGGDEERAMSEGGGDIDEDFDLPPAVDGIGGSASDDDEGTKPANLHLDFGLPTFDKFRNFQLQTIEDQNEVVVKEPLIEKPTTADEGFSEGENSMSVDNDAGAVRISQGPSASSSRNSLSDSDETSKSSSNDEVAGASGGTSAKSKIPKVTKCPCSRQQRISRPPEYLTIHFKRFQMSLGGYPTKITDHVNYPMILDLTEFCSLEGGKTDNGVFDEEEQVLYSLYGIVEHSGSMNWGHYVAYVKASDNDQQWYHISDSAVGVTSFSRVTSVEAYILFYERIRGDEKQRRLSVCLSEPSTYVIAEGTPVEGDAQEAVETEYSWKTVPNAGPSWNNATEDPILGTVGVVRPSIQSWTMGGSGYEVINGDLMNEQLMDSTYVPSIVVNQCETPSPPQESKWNNGIIDYGPSPLLEDWDAEEPPETSGIQVVGCGNDMDAQPSAPRCPNAEIAAWGRGG